jgi:hypothetical protein
LIVWSVDFVITCLESAPRVDRETAARRRIKMRSRLRR